MRAGGRRSRARSLEARAGAALRRAGGPRPAGRALLAVLGAQAVAIAALGLARGVAPLQVALVMAPIAAAAALAAAPRAMGRRGRQVAVALGLVGCSQALVLFADGGAGSHFHVFAMIALVGVFRDPAPRIAALGLVALHLGLAAALAPRAVLPGDVHGAEAWAWSAAYLGAAAVASLAAPAARRARRLAHVEAASAPGAPATAAPPAVDGLAAREEAAGLARAGGLTALRALAHAVDAKDHYTRRHSDRVADVAVRLAALLGWSPGDRARLRDAGVLHDVGKIGVPDAVLLKPGALTDDEYAQVKQHAIIGAAIVGEVLDDEQVLWLRHHHERIDGTGYPDGLTGEHLSQGARIMAVADAWDAMTGAREYRPALDVPAALAECRRQAGSQFCAEVVDALAVLVERDALGVAVPLDALRGLPARPARPAEPA